MIDSIINALANQVPDLVALIVVVWMFVEFLKKRDSIYITAMENLTKKIDSMNTDIEKLSTRFDDAVGEMRRTVKSRNRKKAE